MMAINIITFGKKLIAERNELNSYVPNHVAEVSQRLTTIWFDISKLPGSKRAAPFDWKLEQTIEELFTVRLQS